MRSIKGAAVTIEDQRAANAVLQLLESMRETGRSCGRVEVLVENNYPTQVRIVSAGESVQVQAS